MTRYLLEQDVDINKQMIDGTTARDLAESQQDAEILALLNRRRASI